MQPLTPRRVFRGKSIVGKKIVGKRQEKGLPSGPVAKTPCS